MSKRDILDSQASQIMKCYKTHSQKDTAQIFGVSFATMHNWLQSKNVLRDTVAAVEMSHDHAKRVLSQEELQRLVDFYSCHSLGDTAKEFHLGTKAVKDYLAKAGTALHSKEESQAILKNKYLNKYGTSSPQSLDSIKDKQRATKFERYGNPVYVNTDKRRLTCLETYGTPSASGDPSVREKIRETCLERYGVDNVFKSPEVQEGIAATKQGLYGGRGWDSPELRQKSIDTCRERYGVDWYCLSDDSKIKNGCDSGPNREFESILIQENLLYGKEFIIDHYKYDFRVDNQLIEIDPFPTHNSTWSPYKGSGISSDYHFNKSKVARDNGYTCIHIWDWDDVNKVIRLIKPKSFHLYARECKVQEVPPGICRAFLIENHLQGYVKDSVRLGLYKEDKLIQVTTFGRPRYAKTYQYELLRLCTLNDYTVTGGAEKLFKYFIDNYNPDSVVSYCDLSKFNGDVYVKLGFILKRTSIGKHWYNPKTGVHITDNLLRQRGFDQLLGKEYGCYGKGTSNEQLMLEHDFVEIFDAGQATYIWRNDKNGK